MNILKKRQDKRICVARFRAKFRIQDLWNTNNNLLSCLQKTATKDYSFVSINKLQHIYYLAIITRKNKRAELKIFTYVA